LSVAFSAAPLGQSVDVDASVQESGYGRPTESVVEPVVLAGQRLERR
jgi:hypothetical protein